MPAARSRPSVDGGPRRRSGTLLVRPEFMDRSNDSQPTEMALMPWLFDDAVFGRDGHPCRLFGGCTRHSRVNDHVNAAVVLIWLAPLARESTVGSVDTSSAICWRRGRAKSGRQPSKSAPVDLVCRTAGRRDLGSALALAAVQLCRVFIAAAITRSSDGR